MVDLGTVCIHTALALPHDVKEQLNPVKASSQSSCCATSNIQQKLGEEKKTEV